MSVTVGVADREKMLEAFGGSSDEAFGTDNGSGTTLTDYEANYGHGEELKGLAESGVSFFGASGAGGDYGPLAFAAHGGEYAVVDADMDGNPVVQVDASGTIREERIELIRRYWALRESAELAIGFNLDTSEDETKKET